MVEEGRRGGEGGWAVGWEGGRGHVCGVCVGRRGRERRREGGRKEVVVSVFGKGGGGGGEVGWVGWERGEVEWRRR